MSRSDFVRSAHRLRQSVSDDNALIHQIADRAHALSTAAGAPSNRDLTVLELTISHGTYGLRLADLLAAPEAEFVEALIEMLTNLMRPDPAFVPRFARKN